MAFLFTFTSEYVILNVQEKQKGLKLNGIYQILDYSDDTILGRVEGMYRKANDKETLLDTNKNFVLVVNTQKIKYKLSRHHNAWHHFNISSDCKFLNLNIVNVFDQRVDKQRLGKQTQQ
jgi:uncharacterized protein YktA (UPF0223 family)